MRAGVNGSGGRMGTLLCQLLDDDLVSATDRGQLNETAHADAEVIIDFSLPEGCARLLALYPQTPLVIGTTGLTDQTLAAIAAHRAPVVHASNFSTGVTVLLDLVETAARALPDYDLEIVEMHHRFKVDAPSGTARSLALASGRTPLTHGREGHTGERPRGGIGMHALRGGDVAGEHTVYLAGPGERLQLGHLATSRATFAQGAIRAARWVIGKPPGVYDMKDVLGL